MDGLYEMCGGCTSVLNEQGVFNEQKEPYSIPNWIIS